MAGSASLTIGEVAKQGGVRPSTVRYYESIDLLPKPVRVSGQRRYDGSVLRRIELIRAAQAAGFKLNEIKALFAGFPAHTSASRRWHILAGTKIPEIESLIDRAQQMRGWLELLVHCSCSDLDECAATIQQFREAIEEG